MRKNKKPQIVPTLLSSTALVWSIVLVVLFGAFAFVYSCWTRTVEARQVLEQPVATAIETEELTALTPKGWQRFSRNGGDFRIWKYAEGILPLIRFKAYRDEKNLYHALDRNPSLLIRRLALLLSEERIAATGRRVAIGRADITLHGVELVTVRPGTTGMRFFFSMPGYRGMGLKFYSGEWSCHLFGLVEEHDEDSYRELSDYVCRPQDVLTIPFPVEEIVRPIVNTTEMTPESNRRILAEAERETALWRLFAERAESEPESALVPAIRHFRLAIEDFSSVRQEKRLLETEDYVKYRKLMDMRRATLTEWFVLLDKYCEMKDVEAAKSQAQYIRDHAKLKGEARDARRADDVYRRLVASETREVPK